MKKLKSKKTKSMTLCIIFVHKVIFYDRKVDFSRFICALALERSNCDYRYGALELDVKILSDYSVVDDLYRLVTLLSSRIGNKLDYQIIGVLMGINRHKIKEYIQLFQSTYFLHIIPPFAKNPDRSIALQPKLYVADNGLVNQLAQVGSGAMFENAIANQLLRLGKVQYFQQKSGQEIDFILNEETAVEVKETPAPSDLQSLKKRAASLELQKTMLAGRYPPGIDFSDFVWGGCIF